MKKFIMLLLIFFVSTFFISNVSAYYSSNRYALLDFSNITKDNFKFNSNEDSYYDDLIKIDDYMKTTGYHYTIYLTSKNNNSTLFDLVYIYVNGLYDDGYIYNKISYIYSSTYDNYVPVGVSKNLINYNYSTNNDDTFTILKRGNPSVISSLTEMSNFLTQIESGTYPFSIGSSAPESNKYIFYGNTGSGYDTSMDNTFLGDDIKFRVFSKYFYPFSSSDDVYLFDNNNKGYPVAFISPKSEVSLVINRGDKMPLLINYLNKTYKYRYRTSFNSNSSDTNGVITQIVQKSNHSVMHSDNKDYSVKIELIPNDSTNPIVPDLDSIEVLYCENGKNCVPVSEKYPGHTQEEVMTYEVKNELGIKTIYVNFPLANAMGSYEVKYNFTNADNVTYYVYDSTVIVDNDEDLFYYPVSSYFSGYKRVVFSENYTQLFLSSDKTQTFKIYVPYSSLATENEIVRVGNIDYKTGTINYLDGVSFVSNNYYYEFELSNDYSNNLIGYLSKNNGQVVIYVPNDIFVSYYNFYDAESTGDSDVTIKTPNGFTKIETVIDNKMLNDNFFTTFLEGINYFLSPIKEIFNVIALFFNGLPVGMKYFFVSLFGLTISVFIVRFLL